MMTVDVIGRTGAANRVPSSGVEMPDGDKAFIVVIAHTS